ncbi:MAG: hypothetical protein EA412_10355 [Chitinophagaceae bacterium]|nr:MAG: hypothetical protein EA412_10355 [Chitinophagaceae bacterium]
MSSKKFTVVCFENPANDVQSQIQKFSKDYTIISVSDKKSVLKQLDDSEIRVLLIDERNLKSDYTKILEGLKGKFPALTRIIISNDVTKEKVLEAVNKYHVFAFLSEDKISSELKKILSDAYTKFKKIKEREKLISKLQSSNEQLEFMLREKLIS